jgi:hypothetical protein
VLLHSQENETKEKKSLSHRKASNVWGREEGFNFAICLPPLQGIQFKHLRVLSEKFSGREVIAANHEKHSHVSVRVFDDTNLRN